MLDKTHTASKGFTAFWVGFHGFFFGRINYEVVTIASMIIADADGSLEWVDGRQGSRGRYLNLIQCSHNWLDLIKWNCLHIWKGLDV